MCWNIVSETWHVGLNKRHFVLRHIITLATDFPHQSSLHPSELGGFLRELEQSVNIRDNVDGRQTRQGSTNGG